MSKLEQAISEKNIVGIRNLMKAYLSSDPTDSNATIKQSLQRIQTSGIDIWETQDEKQLSTSKEAWDEDYFVDVQVDLRMNFSKERFLHILEVGKKVYGVSVAKAAAQTTPRPAQNNRPQVQKQQSPSVNNEKKNSALLWGAAAIGAIILIIVLVKMIGSNN